MKRGVLLSMACGLAGVMAMPAAAGTAQAQAEAMRQAVFRPSPRTAMIIPPARPEVAVRASGMARTSVDRRLESGLTASAGFLCGLHPGAERDGGAAASGFDPHGRFLGAKLSFAFR